jgi:DNA helicase-4
MRKLAIEPWWLPRILGIGRAALRASESSLSWALNGAAENERQSVREITCKPGLLWAGLDISLKNGEVVTFTGYRADEAQEFAAEVNQAIADDLLKRQTAAINKAISGWNQPAGKDQFMTEPMYQAWVNSHNKLGTTLSEILRLGPSPSDVRTLASRVIGILRKGTQARASRNEAWVAEQRKKHKKLFTSGMGYPLSDEQIDAVLYDEHRSLIVAGAGTGKTSTIVAKVQWIFAQELSTPERTQLLAFNRDAAQEINTRLGIKDKEDALASTFHSLGNKLRSQAKGEKRRVHKIATDDQLLQRFVRKAIDDGLASADYQHYIQQFLLYFRYPEATPVPLDGSKEQRRFADGHDIRTITGEKVKSNSEALIANWLTTNGIAWQYEEKYEHKTSNPEHSQYLPDFYLPEHQVYIEHWAQSKEGRLPPEWNQLDQLQYRRGMQWKRDLHLQHKTRLVETFSANDGGSSIREALTAAMRRYDIPIRPVSAEELAKLLQVAEIIQPVVKLASSFLALFRENDTNLAVLKATAAEKLDYRALAFLHLFEYLHGKYQALLDQDESIDFADMIREATDALSSGKATIELDYLLVDEFQDISRGRAKLLKAILAANPGCRLVAVGDDWQAIYRFAGSDIGVMTDFEAQFGYTLQSYLTATHRFDTKLEAATSTFVQENPEQIRKNLTSTKKGSEPAIEIVSTAGAKVTATARKALADHLKGPKKTPDELSDDEQRNASFSDADDVGSDQDKKDAVAEVLKRIADDDEAASVLVLGRYGFTEELLGPRDKWPAALQIKFSTMHSAKGMEADYVIALDVISGRWGFPSEIADDPVLNLVLGIASEFPNAEERRLFYVALTRAKKKAFMMTVDEVQSSFVVELEESKYDGLVIPSNVSERVADCPVCKSATLVLRISQYGPFFACSSPRCVGKASKCPECSAGALVRSGLQFKCIACNATRKNCPKCEYGYVKHHSAGKAKGSGRDYAAFDGCSTYRSDPVWKCWTGPCACKS